MSARGALGAAVRRLTRLRPRRRPPEQRRTRLSCRDGLDLALLGTRSRPTRAALSALGVAIGVASLVAITGATDSQQAQIRAELDAMGASMLTVQPGSDGAGGTIALPATAPEMIGRIGPVQRTATVRQVPDAVVFRSDLVPVTQTAGLGVAVTEDDLPAVLDVPVAWGRWFDDASRTLPTAVLGATAAERLGITAANAARARVLVDGRWFGVLGVLDHAGLAAAVDSSVFVGDRWYADQAPREPAISVIYARAASGTVDQVRSVLAATANPASPSGVVVGTLAELAAAQETADQAMSSLVLALSGICLLVGGVGIANTMVVAVMERRGEIGLRRALGARTGQVTWQFLAEAVVLAVLGGLAGTLLGVLVVVGLTTGTGSVLALRPTVLATGPVVAVVVGALAGLYPASRAARQPPTAALRSG